MKLSNKEKVLISTLCGVLVAGIYYQFIYTSQIDKINTLKDEKIKVEAKYNEIMESIASLESRQQEVKDLLSEINFKTKKFYPKIIQEKIILELDEYLRESLLKGDISFNEVTVASVEKLEGKVNSNDESSFQGLVDKYNGVINESESKGTESSQQSTTIESTEESTSTVEMLKVTVNFKGSYETLKKFLSYIEISNREILVTDLSTSAGDNGEISGTMNLEFYSIPKLSATDEEYLEWQIEGDYGKGIPFLIQKSQVVVEDIESNQATSDFAILVKSINSDLPSVMIGKSTDTSQSTYISNKKNGEQDGEIEFTQIDGKYYCKYKLDSNKLSDNYDNNGISFVPSSDNIIVEINSEKRDGIDDNVGLNLTVVNKTDKIVEIVINNDDDSNKRIVIDENSENVKVTRK